MKKPKVEIYCKNPSCFNTYLARHKIKEVNKQQKLKEELRKKNPSKMKKTIIKSERVVYSEPCPSCRKEIKGFSESNLEYNMRLHKEKHDKVKLQIVKE